MKNLLKDSKAYYQDNDYYEIFSQAEDYENKVRDYIKSLIKDKIVLDAGCGTGKFLETIEKDAQKYIGIDLSNDQLIKAKSKSKKSNSIFISSNLTNIPLEDNSVDLIISSWVLGTITKLEERNKALFELKRVLKKDGIMVLVENAENSEFEQLRDRDKDKRTKIYNSWITQNEFKLEKTFNTYFKFKTLPIAIKCFNVIYGETVSAKISSKIIEHKINIYTFQKKS